MSTSRDDENVLSNGPAAAALLSAGAGCCAMGILYIAGNVSPIMNKVLSIYKPAGALSGVSTGSIIVWLVLWAVLARRWAKRDVELNRVGIWSAVLLGAGLLLTFPPIARLF